MAKVAVVVVRELLPVKLTDRQWQVLELRVSGVTCKETARILSLSCKTIDAYQRLIYDKFDVLGLVDLVHACYAAGAIKVT